MVGSCVRELKVGYQENVFHSEGGWAMETGSPGKRSQHQPDRVQWFGQRSQTMV